MPTGSASTEIDRQPDEVWAAIADVTRIGEWSPECLAARWVGGATGPAVGARFEGDNAVKIAGRTVKKWTTTSEVTAAEPGKRFEFLAEGYTTWRYELEPTATGTGTIVTESFEHKAATGFQGFVHSTLLRREAGLTKAMQRTLERLKASLERGPAGA